MAHFKDFDHLTNVPQTLLLRVLLRTLFSSVPHLLIVLFVFLMLGLFIFFVYLYTNTLSNI